LTLIGTTRVVVTVRPPVPFRDTEASELVGVTSTFLVLAAVGFMKLRPTPPDVVVIDRVPLVADERISGLAPGADRVDPDRRAETKLELDPLSGTAPTAAAEAMAVRSEPARDMLLMLLVMELREALELDRLRFSLELVVVGACCCAGRFFDNGAVPDVVPRLLRPLPLRCREPEFVDVFTRLVVEFELLRLACPPPDRDVVEEDVRPLIAGLDLRTASLPLMKADLFKDLVEELMLG